MNKNVRLGHEPLVTPEVAELRSQLSQAISRNSELELELAKIRLETEQMLQNAELIRLRTELGINAFRERLASDLRTYRAQRAWTCMILMRRLFAALLESPRIFKVLAIGGWAIGRLVLFGKKETHSSNPVSNWLSAAIRDYDLSFPDIQTFVPPEIHLPFSESSSVPPLHGTDRVRQQRLDIIMLPVFEFDFRFQRPQHLARQLASNGHRVFWISPSRVCTTGPYEAMELEPGLWEIHLKDSIPNIYMEELDPVSVERGTVSMRALYREWAIAENVVVVELPFWRRLGLRLKEEFNARLLYDCMDDWETMPRISKFTKEQEVLLLAECDGLSTTSRHLQLKHAGTRSSELIRNAVDCGFFARATMEERLASIPRPIVGYYGAIADWFDYSLLAEVATMRERYSFVLIGGYGMESQPSGGQVSKLRALPNVHFLGHQPYAVIPQYLVEFDVCIIPFLLNEVTKATDPVKLYEYLSLGKPVVATPMQELQEYSTFVYLAHDAESFCDKLDAALAEQGTALQDARREFASKNSWSHRYEAFSNLAGVTFPLISILIVTYNSESYIKSCLESILKNTFAPKWEIVVVDNGSTDATLSLIQDYAERDSRIVLVRLQENLGFSFGNNQAAIRSKGDFLIFLNADTVVSPGWTERLIRHLQRDSTIGVVVPVTNWAGNEAKINTYYSNRLEMEDFALQVASVRMAETYELKVAPFFCACLRRTTWTEVGQLDERFEVGMFEDDDYSLRVRNQGLRIVAAEDCFVHHFGRAAFSKLDQIRYETVFQANRRRFEEKWGIAWEPHRFREGTRGDHTAFDPDSF